MNCQNIVLTPEHVGVKLMQGTKYNHFIDICNSDHDKLIHIVQCIGLHEDWLPIYCDKFHYYTLYTEKNA